MLWKGQFNLFWWLILNRWYVEVYVDDDDAADDDDEINIDDGHGNEEKNYINVS